MDYGEFVFFVSLQLLYATKVKFGGFNLLVFY